jgi:hypothetical protein
MGGEMTDWFNAFVWLLGIVAAWDMVRRVAGGIATRALQVQLDGLQTQVTALAADRAVDGERLKSLEKTQLSVSNRLEGLKAPARRFGA